MKRAMMIALLILGSMVAVGCAGRGGKSCTLVNNKLVCEDDDDYDDHDIVWYDSNGTILGKALRSREGLSTGDVAIGICANSFCNRYAGLVYLNENCEGVPFISESYYYGHEEEEGLKGLALDVNNKAYIEDTDKGLRDVIGKSRTYGTGICYNSKSIRSVYPAIEYTLPDKIKNAVFPLNFDYVSNIIKGM